MSSDGFFTKAKCKLVLDHPFLSVLALHMIEKNMDMGNPVIQQLAMPTCGVDGQNLYVNPDWVKSLSDDERLGLLAHEVMHVALGHVWPWRRQWRDKHKWNVAGDYVINDILMNDNTIKGGFKLPNGGLHNQKYSGMSTEEVYNALDDKTCPKPPWQDLLEAVGDASSGSGQKKTEAEMRALERDMKDLLAQAVQVAKMRGKLPAGMERLVDDLLNPKIPWYQLLELYINEILRDDYDESHHDRRYVQQGFYLPDLYNEGAKVVIAVDTSGSIGGEEIKAFVSETVGILRSRCVTEARIIACDAKITLDETLHQWDEVPTDFPGGGGTDFTPVFKRIEKGYQKPSCLIYLTDTFGAFPEEPPDYPVIWATMTDEKQAKVPWGLRIVFDMEDSGVTISQADDDDVPISDSDDEDDDD